MVFPVRYALEGAVKQAPKAQASGVSESILPKKNFSLFLGPRKCYFP